MWEKTLEVLEEHFSDQMLVVQTGEVGDMEGVKGTT
jgi:hypothetical protein